MGDDKNFIGAVLMDLSKAFIFPKSCSQNIMLMVYDIKKLYIILWKEDNKDHWKVSNTECLFRILLSRVPQESVLGPVLLNVSINDLNKTCTLWWW